jgi:hypothetical protein
MRDFRALRALADPDRLPTEAIDRPCKPSKNYGAACILAERAKGLSLRGVAEVLNNRGVKTARGETWAATQVSDILERAGP